MIGPQAGIRSVVSGRGSLGRAAGRLALAVALALGSGLLVARAAEARQPESEPVERPSYRVLYTAWLKAGDPVAMAWAMRWAVDAGRAAYLAGRMPRREVAVPSSPTRGMLG